MVTYILDWVFGFLESELCSTDCIEELFDLVVKLDRSRII